MTWKKFVREMERSSARAARDRAREHSQNALHADREYKAAVKAYEKEVALKDAADHASRFVDYLDHLVTLHNRCSPDYDWAALLTASAPVQPHPKNTREAAAQQAVDAFRPGPIARLTGAAKKREAELRQVLFDAKLADSTENEQQALEHQQALRAHESAQELAQGVLRLEPDALERAIEPIREQEDFEALGLEIHVVEVEQDAAAVDCILTDDEVVPSEDVGLTSTGKLSTKKMNKTKYWDIYQDFVCSCALRIAGEVFALLPVSRTVVNIAEHSLNTSTGHMETNVLLGVHVTRAALASINLKAIDPSDSMANFGNRMDFKKTTGLKSIERVHLAENWAEK